MIFSSITRYLGFYRKYLGNRLYGIFLLTLCVALAESLGITLLLPLIEAVDTTSADYDNPVTRSINTILSWIEMEESTGAILAFIAIVFFMKGLLKFAEGGYKGYLEAQVMRELKARMYDAYNAMDYRYFIQRNTGHFVNVINQQVMNCIHAFNSLLTFLTQSIMAIGYLSVAFFIAWNFALMAVMVGGILFFLFKTLNIYVTNLSRKTAKEKSNLNKFLIQTLQAFKYINSTSQNDHLRGGVIKSVDKLAGYLQRQRLAQAFTTSLQEPLSVIFLICIVAIQVFVLGAAVGPIVVALLLFHRGMRATIGIQSNWQRTMEKIGSLEMVEEEFQTTADSREKDGNTIVNELSHKIEYKNVSFAYEQDEEIVIKDLSIDIPVNKTIAFVGESGAGKSTLVDLMTLMLRPIEGEIFIDGVRGSDVNRHSWRTQIGYVSQETVIFDDTVSNNISLWDSHHSSEVQARVRKAAVNAYADEFIRELPDGYDTIVGDRGIRLSGGQKQRLFIARELYKNPNLLILDEATSALDSESERYIQEGIDQLKGTMTVVIIAHRLSTIKNVDLIYVLDKGKIVERGTFGELTENSNSRFNRMVAYQNI